MGERLAAVIDIEEANSERIVRLEAWRRHEELAQVLDLHDRGDLGDAEFLAILERS